MFRWPIFHLKPQSVKPPLSTRKPHRLSGKTHPLIATRSPFQYTDMLTANIPSTFITPFHSVRKSHVFSYCSWENSEKSHGFSWENLENPRKYQGFRSSAGRFFPRTTALPGAAPSWAARAEAAARPRRGIRRRGECWSPARQAPVPWWKSPKTDEWGPHGTSIFWKML